MPADPRIHDTTEPVPGRYLHFKGGEYEVVSVGRHTETGERVVVYFSVDKPEVIWVRPLDMFTESVDRPEGTTPRFRLTNAARQRVGA